MTKELCECGKIAVWCYLPGYSSGDNPHFCDECVPRGCSCNYIYCDPNSYHPPLDEPNVPEGIEGRDWKWIEKGKIYTDIDHEGREYPCAEFMYDIEGFERELNPHII
jgi:hypothetical protein